ncbi:MAG: hypothetical protein IT385_25455 [Deltaproteobacteria bacterium]|nr:hypothetical protein [Deltaproteobacteria bacterium]
MRPLRQLVLVPFLLTLPALALSACGDETKRLPIGSTCSDDEECQGGVCGGGLCLDPALDTDNDGLVNRIEAGLDTDPVEVDTDGDELADGVEVGVDPNKPVDSDGDGRIDALESAIDDCDGDELPDQMDADDGVDEEGVCRTVVVSPCQDLCARAVQLQCPEASAGCLTSCSEAFTEADAACRVTFTRAAECVLDAEGVGCAFSNQPPWQLYVPGGVCEAETQAATACLGGGIECSPPTVIALDATVQGTLADQTSLMAYAIDLPGAAIYSIVVTPQGSLDDPSVAVFNSTQQRCDWLANPTGTLPAAVSDEPAGAPERIDFPLGSMPQTIEVLVVNARESGATAFTIQVRVRTEP